MHALNPETWSLVQGVSVFACCAVVITIAGTRITRVVDQLADRTGIGEAVAGAVFLGGATSLAGSVLSVTAAWKGHPELAVSNALGGIAVQTLFLAIADLCYRRANLEHAAASAPNMLQNALLISLLALILLAPLLPNITLFHIHPVTPVLIGFYWYGIRLVRGARLQPMWFPSLTRETRHDVPHKSSLSLSTTTLWFRFILLMGALALAGWVLEPAADNIALKTGLSQTAVGVLLTAISTSIPELVTSIAAVRCGALTLAVGGIIGGNVFDALFTAVSDIAYREGSIYHAMPEAALLWVTLTLFMSGIMMMGLIRREEQGIAHIGMESTAIIVLYAIGVFMLLTGNA